MGAMFRISFISGFHYVCNTQILTHSKQAIHKHHIAPICQSILLSSHILLSSWGGGVRTTSMEKVHKGSWQKHYLKREHQANKTKHWFIIAYQIIHPQIIVINITVTAADILVAHNDSFIDIQTSILYSDTSGTLHTDRRLHIHPGYSKTCLPHSILYHTKKPCIKKQRAPII